jgi:hypothetical protein
MSLMNLIENLVLCEGSLEVVLLWISAALVMQVFRSFITIQKPVEAARSYLEMGEASIVPLKISTEELMSSYPRQEPPTFTLFTIYEESCGSMESLVDLSTFGVKFEKIKYDENINNFENIKGSVFTPMPSKLLAFSKALRFSSNYNLDTDDFDDEIKTSLIEEAVEKDSSDWKPPRPRTPDFIELIRRMPKIESIFDEEAPESIEVLDLVDEEKFKTEELKVNSANIINTLSSMITSNSPSKPTINPKDAVKILMACNIL